MSCVFQAEDGSNTIVVRLHEAYGGPTEVEMMALLPLASVEYCDGLERKKETEAKGTNSPLIKWNSTDGTGTITLSLQAFQIITLRISYHSL